MPSFINGDANGSPQDTGELRSAVVFRLKRTDEYIVNFSNTSNFAVERWTDTQNAILAELSSSDREVALECRNGEALIRQIEDKRTSPESSTTVKRQHGKITQLPDALENLVHRFRKLVAPSIVDFEMVWGIIYVNLKLSYISEEHLRKTADLLGKMRRTVELFNRSLDACYHPNEVNESRIAVVDYLDLLATILIDLNKHLNRCVSEPSSSSSWLSFTDSMVSQFGDLDQAVKHVNDISTYSQVNRQDQVKNLALRHELKPESEEQANFPNSILERKNTEFYGRREEIDLIKVHLNPEDGMERLRTYMIYGRRGVGKTAIALQFAHENLSPRGVFDAIFWIQCETSVSIRQSFTEVAVSLNLPGADRDRHHEENLDAVHKWLKRTKKKWLLIFDNAENEITLRGYMPVGVNGSILMTSRKWYNYTKDVSRHGETVKPFDPDPSWELLLGFLGDDWKQKVESPGEMEAAKAMLGELEGLALAIVQTAVLIKDPEIGGTTIVETYARFKETKQNLPERYASERSSSEKALDALWDIIFRALQPNARVLLGVLAWLSPDKIPIDLFLPRDQSALDGPLWFCKQDPKNIDDLNRASLFSLITTSPAFDDAIEDLLRKRLISREGRFFKIHRVVQEATNFHSFEDLQKSFNTASRLVFQQFPDREPNETLYKQWNICREYIPHGIQLRIGYSKYNRNRILQVPREFEELMSNCAWYLYELGDYTTTSLVCGTGLQACRDKESMVYAELRLINGCQHYDLNELGECRKSWEESLRVREKLLENRPNDIRIAAIYNNIGNLELAAGNEEGAEEYYVKAMKLWHLGGDQTAQQLAVTYLCLGRFYMLQGDFPEAIRYTNLSETLFVRTAGPDLAFIANVHYLFGNIHLAQGDLDSAWLAYDTCLKIALPIMPLHPLTASAWFSLGVTQRAKKNYSLAFYLFGKAKIISELRSPTSIDGAIARVLWHMARVIEEDKKSGMASLEETLEDARDLRRQAEMAKQRIRAAGQGREVLPAEEENPDRGEEVSYDLLLPLFFR
ncbi:hypothetical protein ONS95_007437 [Cadophora gregata]|uniref:uncharacterized protein n=1 Tax=Cadophora gregata TaxID=51156 RepID=UPI0026DAB813|nr:uncharacterized protein ONS95_007437 [Cadophora gregata]KAK0125805.1 hypothetical protein ONS95_007437 [Cadophora gregata]